MKNNLKYILWILPILFAAGACKNPVGDDFGVSNASDYSVIYTVQALDDVSKNTFEMMVGDQITIIVNANYGGLLPLGEDVKVRFKVVPELVDDYNNEHGTSYRIMPEKCYAASTLEATIKKGERTSSPVTVSVDSEGFEGVGIYVLPLHIESVSPQMTVNEDLRTAFLFCSTSFSSNPYVDIDRTDWSVIGFSSEDSYGKNYAVEAIDGDPATFWHTKWWSATPEEQPPGPPHHIDIDMGQAETIHGFRTLSRVDGYGVLYPGGGHPKSVGFYTKLNEVDDWTYQGVFEMLPAISDYKFLDYPAEARYIRFQVKLSYNDKVVTSLAELYAF